MYFKGRKRGLLFFFIALLLGATILLIPNIGRGEYFDQKGWVITDIDSVNRQFFYAQNPNERVGGVKVLANVIPTQVKIGNLADIKGELQVFNTERRIINPTVNFSTETRTLPKPLMVNQRDFANSIAGTGAPIAGNLVTIWGKALPLGAGANSGYKYFFVDDGTGVWNPSEKTAGIKVYFNPLEYPNSDIFYNSPVTVTGIASVEEVGDRVFPIVWAQNIKSAAQ
jgi:hypothetical protein